jgi:hypothetical protein
VAADHLAAVIARAVDGWQSVDGQGTASPAVFV